YIKAQQIEGPYDQDHLTGRAGGADPREGDVTRNLVYLFSVPKSEVSARTDTLIRQMPLYVLAFFPKCVIGGSTRIRPIATKSRAVRLRARGHFSGATVN